MGSVDSDEMARYSKRSKFQPWWLGVEQSDNRLLSGPVDRILLEETIPAMSMFYVYIAPQTNPTYNPDQNPP